jgi:flagellar hook-associated protein 3 FlgL
MIRIGSFAAQNLTLAKNMETQARLHEKHLQVSTGFKAQRYDGIAPDARRLEGLETKHAKLGSYTKAVDRTDQRLAEMENAVGQLQDIASNFRTLLLQAGSADNLASSNVQSDAEQMLKQVESILNTDYEGRYLFAGSATDTPPINLSDGGGPMYFLPPTAGDPSISNGDYYEGNGQVLSVQADRDLEVDYGVTAEPGNDSGFDQLIQSLGRIARPDAPLDNPEIEAALGQLSNEPDGAIARLADTRADLGSTRAVLETTRQRLEDTRLVVEEDLTDIEQVDMARAMTELSSHQNTLESSYAVTARMSRLSLLDFLR